MTCSLSMLSFCILYSLTSPQGVRFIIINISYHLSHLSLTEVVIGVFIEVRYDTSRSV